MEGQRMIGVDAAPKERTSATERQAATENSTDRAASLRDDLGTGSVRDELMIVDDDALTRELLLLLAEDAGFRVEGWESGAEALAAIAARGAQGRKYPRGVLADLQMPGPNGARFAELTREACGTGTRLIAMSGTAVSAESIRGYDGFLLKPFTSAAMCAALRGGETGGPGTEVEDWVEEALNARTFEALSCSMPVEQLRRLYALCLDDAKAKLEDLRRLAAERDEGEWRSTAHAVKGSCAMVGASELARLAGALETGSFPEIGDAVPFRTFLEALARLRRIVEARLT